MGVDGENGYDSSDGVGRERAEDWRDQRRALLVSSGELKRGERLDR
jgi:hypothetical protein